MKINKGLSQGTQLAPLLFLIYINNITDYLCEECELFCYADDLAVVSNSRLLSVAVDDMNNQFKNNQKMGP